MPALLDEIPYPLFQQWMAYAQLEPFGEERADLRAGIVAAAASNAGGVRGAPAKPRDFMPDFEGASQTPDEMIATLKAAAAAAKIANLKRAGK